MSSVFNGGQLVASINLLTKPGVGGATLIWFLLTGYGYPSFQWSIISNYTGLSIIFGEKRRLRCLEMNILFHEKLEETDPTTAKTFLFRIDQNEVYLLVNVTLVPASNL